MEGNVDLILTYGLYNDGWILDSCEIDEDGQYGVGTFEVQEGLNLTEEKLLKIMADYGDAADSITVKDYQFDLEQQKETYSIHATKAYTYVTESWDTFIEGSFIGNKDAGYYGAHGIWDFWVNGGFVRDGSWDIEGTYKGENDGTVVYIPYTEPADNMVLTFEGSLQREFGPLVDINTSDISFKHLAALLSIRAEDYISAGYSVCFWDGQNKNYNKLSYYDFDYITVNSYMVTAGYYSIIDTILIGPRKIAYIDHNAVSIDTVDHVVYVEIEELIPIS